VLKKNWKYFIPLLLVFVGIVYLQISAPKPINWSKTFLQKDKIPFGSKALYDVLEQSAFKDRISTNKKNIYQSNEEDLFKENGISYIFINDNLGFDDIETKTLLEQVEKGNNIFLACNNLSGLLKDTLNIETNLDFSYFLPENKGLAYEIYYHKTLKDEKKYEYHSGITPIYFTSIDTNTTRIIASNANNDPVFICAKLGKGEIYLLSTPEFFTNYSIANKPSKEFAYTCLSYLNTPKIIWDEHYKTHLTKVDSELQFIFKNDSLYAAYLITVLGTLLFMFFNLRRKQRAIPIVAPPTNSSIEFVEVIGNVYFNAKNHKIIAEEKINSFLETIRIKFQVNTRLFDDALFTRVSKLSGIHLDEIKELFNFIDQIQFSKSITEQTLIDLNTRLEKFHEQNIR
jgi:hypothetical protein